MQDAIAHHKKYSFREELAQAIFSDVALGIIVIDKNEKIRLVNPFALQLFDYTEKELAGNKIEALIPVRFHKKDIPPGSKYLSDAYKHELKIETFEFYGLKKDGSEFPLEISLGYFKGKKERYTIIYFNDITLRKSEEARIQLRKESLEEKVEERTHKLKKALEDLEASRSKLQRSLEKEKALNDLKSRFVTIASHEFRTPLSTILSSAFLLDKYIKTEDQPRRQKHIDRIISSVSMLTDILNDFLSVGKIEEGKIVITMSNFDISIYIDNILDEMKSLHKKGQKIFYEHIGEKMIRFDAGIFKHIIMNLLSNAIKFSPEDTVIQIKTIRKRERLLLTVKDQGMGISKEDLQHLYERFYRGSNVTNIQGTGLGLNIVSKYSELLHGKISCISELGKGTEFKIEFNLREVAKDETGVVS